MVLIATDLDGTLLRSDGSLSAYTARVLSALDSSGIPVLFVTARPLRWMEELWPLVGSHGIAVLGNGAIWFDVPTRSVRDLRGIDAEEGIPICRAISDVLPGVAFAIECLDGIRFDPGYVPDQYSSPDRPRGGLEEIWTATATKLLVQGQGWDPTQLQGRAIAAVGDRAAVTWTSPHLLELSAPGVTKAATLARVCEHLGVDPSDVLAFGDMPNDCDMLSWAGRSFAVANADPAVRSIADHIIPANDEDGVARTLARRFGLESLALAEQSRTPALRQTEKRP